MLKSKRRYWKMWLRSINDQSHQKKNHVEKQEIKNIVIRIKNLMALFNSRLDTAN